MSSRVRKFLFLTGTAAVAVILLAVFVVPSLVDVNRYRQEVEIRLRAETGKPVQIGHLALTLLPTISIRLDDLEVGNPKNFPPGRLLSVKTLYAVVSVKALLHRVVKITSLDLDNVNLRILSRGQGQWNYQNPSRAVTPPGHSSDPPLFTLAAISNIRIEHARWSIADVMPSNRAAPAFFEARNISAEFSKINWRALSGSHADPSAKTSLGGRLFPLAAGENSPTPAVQGTLKAKSLRFGAVECTAFKSNIRIYPHKVLLDHVSMEVDGGRAQGMLALDFSGSHLRYTSDAQMRGVDVARALASLPKGRGKMTGTLDGHLELSGEMASFLNPLLALEGSASLTVRNGTLPTLQLNKNLVLLARAVKLGPAVGNPSSFSSISADLDVAKGFLHCSKILLVGNGMTATGSGDMSLADSQSLNYRGTATLAAAQTALTNLLAGVLGGSYSNGKLSIPFLLKGTLDHPRFILRVMGSDSK